MGQNFGKYKEKIDIIPNNTEKFMSISIGNDRNKKGCMYLRFIDSLQFMNESLDGLVKNTNNFYHLEFEITNNNKLLKRRIFIHMTTWIHGIGLMKHSCLINRFF